MIIRTGSARLQADFNMHIFQSALIPMTDMIIWLLVFRNVQPQVRIAYDSMEYMVSITILLLCKLRARSH